MSLIYDKKYGIATVPSAVEGDQCSSELQTSTVAGVAALYADTKKRKKKPGQCEPVKKPKPASLVPTADKATPKKVMKKPRQSGPKQMPKPASSVPAAFKDQVASGEDRHSVLDKLKLVVQKN